MAGKASPQERTTTGGTFPMASYWCSTSKYLYTSATLANGSDAAPSLVSKTFTPLAAAVRVSASIFSEQVPK
jgi:hypothetical protein